MTATLRLIDPAQANRWNDEDIKSLAGQNRRLAMDMVVRKYRDRLYYHAIGIVKDHEEAYDVVQEVFIRAIREPRFFDVDFREKAWLFRVTSNLCFNLVRDKRRRGAILDANPMSEAVHGDQLDQVFNGQRRGELLAAIHQMTEDHQEILLLRYYSDLSYAEIADALDIKLGTVMSRLSRARARLLELVGDGATVAVEG
jgi:RNA polymerase sigma-70 factor (ECF subfamily)